MKFKCMQKKSTPGGVCHVIIMCDILVVLGFRNIMLTLKEFIMGYRK